MDVYAHEKEQIEGIKSWWRENRWYVVGGLVVSMVLVGGWRWWLAEQQAHAEAASLKYETVVTQASTGGEELKASVAELQSEYAGTPYASLATLKLAAAQVEAADYAAAAESLRWVMDNTDDGELALVARLRLARVQLQQGDFASVHAALDVANAGKFSALFEETRGDAFLASGDRENARVAYEAALSAIEPGIGDSRRVQMKIDNLAMPLDALLGDTVVAPAEGEAAAGDQSAE